MVRIFGYTSSGQSLLFVLRMTVTMTITLTGLEAVRISDDRGSSRKNANTHRIDHKIRATLPIQYDFPYRFVFPANHPYSSYTQFLGLPPAATPTHSGGGSSGGRGGGSSSAYELYSPIASSPFASNLYQHQHLHQHQHQLQLQPPPQPILPPPAQPPLPPQIPQTEFQYAMKPSPSNQHHHSPHASATHGLGLAPFQAGSAPTVLLLHASNPAAGATQTFLLIPASTTDAGQSFNVGAPYPPNILSTLAGSTISLAGGVGGAAGGGVMAAAPPQATISGAAAAAHAGIDPMMAPILLRSQGHTKLANSHYHNQINAAQLITRPVGGVYQLPMVPLNTKFYKRKKNLLEAKMSQTDNHGMESSSVSLSTSTENIVPKIRNGHTFRISEPDESSSDSSEDYAPDSQPSASPKRS